MSLSTARLGSQVPDVDTKVGTDREVDAAGRIPLPPSTTYIEATGLTVVYEPDDCEPVLDIVFIHGLQGHPFKTWAAEVEDRALNKFKSIYARIISSKSVSDAPADVPAIFWPRDLLPLQCPKARVLVFGYKTAIAKHQFAGAVNKNSIFAHSKDLVNDLSRARPRARPVLFVTHSLGGIVIKETLAICSTSSSEDFEDILKSNAGVVFLGTPHRGSSAAGIGEIARKTASALLMDTNARLLDSLSLKNSDLERCQDIFSSLWLKYGFQVKTFQEGLPLKLGIRLGQSKMVKVVPDISSCLGDSRERAETLDADHRSMCRFSSAQDPNFRKVTAELHAVYSSFSFPKPQYEGYPEVALVSAPIHNDQDLLFLLEHLRFQEIPLRLLAIGSPADNTCQWLPDTESFKTWTERRNVDIHSGLLQIVGKPGSGKSILMKRLFETTSSTSHTSNNGTCVAGHFFNRRGQTLEHCAEGLLRSILCQLGTIHPICFKSFAKDDCFDLEKLRVTDPSSYLNVLKGVFKRIFSTQPLAPRRTFIFIDGLDECNSSEAAEIGYFFADLTSSAHKANVKLDVCISRREYPSITIRNCLEIHMEAHNVQDIRQYVHQKLEMAGVGPGEAEPLQQTIVRRSNGIFLWVVLAVQGILRDVESGKNAKLILKRTETLPKALEVLFAQILEAMNPEELGTAIRVFQWAILATGRLRVREWHHILAFLREKPPSSLKEWEESDFHTETDTQLERQLRTLSQGLVEVKGGIDAVEATGDAGSLLAGAGSLDSTVGDSRVVQPIHETVAEFFTSGRANRLFGLNPEYDFVGGGHLSIAITCLDYISITELDELYEARQLQLKREQQRQERRQQQSGDGSGLRRRRSDASSSWSTLPYPSKEEEHLERSMIALRRRGSVTSFMSSASAHSAKYSYQEDENGERSRMHDILGTGHWMQQDMVEVDSRQASSLQLDQMRDSPPPWTLPDPGSLDTKSDASSVDGQEDFAAERMSDPGILQSTDTNAERGDILPKCVTSTSPESLVPFESMISITKDSPSRQMQIDGKRFRIGRGSTNDGCSIVSSTKSQTLQINPSLMSYALNRAFVHARAGYVLGADPTNIIRIIVFGNGWSRWAGLQRSDTHVETWEDFLSDQRLGSWIFLALDMKRVVVEKQYSGIQGVYKQDT